MNDLHKALLASAHVWHTPDFTDQKTGTQASSLILDGELWIVFEATDDWDDIKTHIRLWPARIGGRWAHAGFVRALNAAYLWVCGELAANKDMKRPVVFSGHSLGGALAALAVCAFRTANDCMLRAVTTGAPKVWLGRHRDPVARYVTTNDPIQHLPPLYSHGAEAKQIKSNHDWRTAHYPFAYAEGQLL